MDEVLTAFWLDGAEPIPVIDQASVSVAREAVRALGRTLGLEPNAIEAAALVASELGHNQLAHARRGRLAVRETLGRVGGGGSRGIEVIAADEGPGIPDPTAALTGTGPRSGSLGIGLSAVRSMAHELDVDVRTHEGSCLWARVFASRPEVRRREVAILGRPCRGEGVSGDDAVFLRSQDALCLGVADGLGHGPLAREAAQAAVVALRAERASVDPAAVLATAHDAVCGTRGAVMAVARIDEVRGEVEHASIGNVVTRVEGHGRSRSFTGSASVLGTPAAARRRAPVEHAVVEPEDAIVMFSDGLSGRLQLGDRPDLKVAAAVTIAQWLMATFARDSDDALVLVAK